MAFLKAIELRGFKTFARPTEILLVPGVTVIIGPNGSGKSNLADAVLWALGEQSPNALRGKGMQDVLFAGSKGHQPSAAAEVSLLFDNSQGEFPGGYQEVQITRRVLREGASEYFINGSACRLLDLQELCAAVGLGREMHSVISQGKVDELLNSSPSARRALVEEAAGLSLYKKRRDRAQAKMSRVRADLERVGDVERELRTTLRPLKQQASAAQKHLELSEAAAECQALLTLRAVSDLRAEMGGLQEARERLLQSRARSERELESLRGRRVEEEAAFARALADREERAAAFHRAQADAQRLEQRLSQARQRHARLEAEAERMRRRREAAEAERVAAHARLEAVASLPALSEGRLGVVRRAAAALGEQLAQRQPLLEQLDAGEESRKDTILELESRRSRDRQRLEVLRREREEMERRGQAATARAAEATDMLRGLDEQMVEAEEDRAEAAAAAASAADAARQVAGDLAGMKVKVSEAAAALRREQEAAASLEGRLRVLEGVLHRRDGLPVAAAALLQTRPGARLLVELLQVSPGYEQAVAAALGPLADAVVLEEEAGMRVLAGAAGPLETIGTGRSAEAQAGEVGAGEQDGVGGHSGAGRSGGFPVALWDVVSAPPGVIACLRRLLPPTTLVESLESWEREWGRPPGDRRLVSSGGEVVTYGLHAARRLSVGSEAILRAKRETAECRAALEEAEVAVARASEHLSLLEQAAAGAQAERERRERAAAEARRAVARLQEAENVFRSRFDQAQQAGAAAQGEAERLEAAQRSLRQEEEELEAALRESEGGLSAEREALHGAREEQERLRRLVAFLQRKTSQAAVLEVRLREQSRARRQELDFVTRQAETVNAALVRLYPREAAVAALLPEVSALTEVTEALAAYAAGAVRHLEGKADASRQASAQFGDVLRELADQEAGLQRGSATTGEQLAETQVRLAHLADRLQQEEEMLEELKRRHLSPRSVLLEAALEADMEQVAARLQDLLDRKERLGPVNPLADRECREVSERLALIGEQRRDLEDSLAELSKVIDDLQRHIATVFASFFEEVRRNFREMVSVLFPGARGELRLEETKPAEGADAEEEAEGEATPDGQRQPTMGINLEIKLPHKAPRTLTLLSGGEKALTAIAFLFALFLARPCPFYILDEVEAALDDHNIGRFLSLLTRYQERTQFLVVTHQRRTMEIADTLYGVTMGDDGVSRVLSRRLKQPAGAVRQASS